MSQSISQMKVKLYIVQAPCGAKGDFLAGWLGTLPTFLDSNWTIDCETGQSFTMAKFFKFFDRDATQTKDLQSFLQLHQYTLDPDPDYFIVGTAHDPMIYRYIDPAYRHLVKILSIKIGFESRIEIQWNFIVKTMLTRHRYNHAFVNGITFGVDYFLKERDIDINDNNRLKFIDSYMRRENLNYPIQPNPLCDHLLEYEKLFELQGSRYLQQQLSLDCSQRNHELWDSNLKFSHSPYEIERFGRMFRFSDFRHMLKNQTNLLL